jgi:hypothetical protein
MADWLFQGNPERFPLHAEVARSREHWWSTPRYRDQIARDDRVWIQIVGHDHPGLYYVATVTVPVHPGSPVHEAGATFGQWRTDLRFDYRIDPPLLRSELLDDPGLGGFRPFHGFQGSAFPVPAEVAAALAQRAEPRLKALD